MKVSTTCKINISGVQINDQPWDKCPEMTGALVKDLRKVYDARRDKYSKFHKMDPFCKLGYLAGEFLFDKIQETIPGHRIGMFLTNSFSSIHTDIAFYNSYSADEQSIASPSLFVYTLPNILLGELAIRHKITGEHAFFLREQFGSDFIYLYVKCLFDRDLIDAAIVGGVEVTPATFHAKMAWISRDETIGNEETLNAETFGTLLLP